VLRDRLAETAGDVRFASMLIPNLGPTQALLQPISVLVSSEIKRPERQCNLTNVEGKYAWGVTSGSAYMQP
jgi:hypothetical protein